MSKIYNSILIYNSFSENEKEGYQKTTRFTDNNLSISKLRNVKRNC